MALKCGLVGLPNVGKSTLFNALTQAGVAAENFAFCTLDPHTGVVAIPDQRLENLASLVKPQKIVPATMEFIDIAGLVKGASEGEGLGNQFLANIRETQAIIHLLRGFVNEDISHVEQKIDPLSDMEIVNTELSLADLTVAEKAKQKHERKANSGDKEARALTSLMQDKVLSCLNSGKALRSVAWTKEESEALKPFCFLTMKQVIYVINQSDDNKTNLDTSVLEEQILAEGNRWIKINAQLEAELAELSLEDRKEFLAELGLEEPALNRLIRCAYELLSLHNFFTAGPTEARAWTIPQGSNAQQAAGVIHSDFARLFIRAEVIKYDDFIACGSEQGAKKKGLWRLEGKDYIVQDGDVMHFRTGA